MIQIEEWKWCYISKLPLISCGHSIKIVVLLKNKSEEAISNLVLVACNEAKSLKGEGNEGDMHVFQHMLPIVLAPLFARTAHEPLFFFGLFGPWSDFWSIFAIYHSILVIFSNPFGRNLCISVFTFLLSWSLHHLAKTCSNLAVVWSSGLTS